MSGPLETSWSNDSNAPQIPFPLYLAEREAFAGLSIAALSYGIVVVLFFQCMAALLGTAKPIKRGMRWLLVAHTVALFSFFTISTTIHLNNSSTLYIDNREFPGNDEYPPGPLGYSNLFDLTGIAVVFKIMFPLNQWLADGLLLHRCFIIYSMNHWVMAFPYLMYFASVAMGIAYIYWGLGMRSCTDTATNTTTSYYSICLSLNILLTLMIAVRLLVHTRNLRKATGALGGSSGLHTVVTMIVESYALYAAALIGYIVPWAVNSSVVLFLSQVLGAIQVIAPYLIILRVAKRRAMTSEAIAGPTVESLRFRRQVSTGGDESLPVWQPVNPMAVNDGALGKLYGRDENDFEGVPL